jgi:hypothetical protein
VGQQSVADPVVLRRTLQMGQSAIANGRRAVAIGGNVAGSVIVTGDGNNVSVQGASAAALRQLVSDIKDLRDSRARGTLSQGFPVSHEIAT